MNDPICVCGCQWSRHYNDPDHHGEKLGCMDCPPGTKAQPNAIWLNCPIFEEDDREYLNNSKPPKLFFPEGY